MVKNRELPYTFLKRVTIGLHVGGVVFLLGVTSKGEIPDNETPLCLSLPLSFDGYFQPINHHHNTRTRVNFVFSLPRPRTERGKQSIKYQGVKIWEEIPLDIQNCSDLKTFCDRLK